MFAVQHEPYGSAARLSRRFLPKLGPCASAAFFFLGLLLREYARAVFLSNDGIADRFRRKRNFFAMAGFRRGLPSARLVGVSMVLGSTAFTVTQRDVKLESITAPGRIIEDGFGCDLVARCSPASTNVAGRFRSNS